MNNVLINDLEKLDRGFLHTCRAVAESYGAEGKLALLEHADPTMPPESSKDGISIMNRIRYVDKFENFGAFLVRQIGAKVLAEAGDSTTTSAIFAKAFIENFPDRKKYNKSVEKGIEIAYREAIKKLEKYSRPIDNKKLRNIAIVSANNDVELGELIIKAYNSVGVDGIVELRKDYKADKSSVVTSTGMKIEKGFHTPLMVNDEITLSWKAEDVLVVALEAWMSDETIKQFIHNNRYKEDGVTLQPMLLVFEKLEDISFVMDLEKFAQRKLYNICAIVTPGNEKFNKLTYLSDVATYTNGEVYQPEGVIKAGKADYVKVDINSTTIISNKNEKVESLLTTLKEQLNYNTDDFLKERIQRLEAVSCILTIGGRSIVEVDEIHFRADDSLRSVKTSVEEGIIYGGGSCLAYISNKMTKKLKNSDEQLGYDLIKSVLLEPFRQLLKNANREEKIDEYLPQIYKTYGRGYNAKTDKMSNLFSDGIIDSKKAIRCALDSSKSVCGKLLSTNVIVTFTN